MAFTTSQGRTRTSLAEINVTPFVDVMLVLLIIFMVTAPILESGIEVDLPKTRTVKAVDVEKIVITIDRRQTLYLGNEAININLLGSSVSQRLRGSTTTPVFIRADESVPFGTFARVVDTLKQAGVTNINVVTEPLSTKGT
jgi:biopolymer transport protein TolR